MSVSTAIGERDMYPVQKEERRKNPVLRNKFGVLLDMQTELCKYKNPDGLVAGFNELKYIVENILDGNITEISPEVTHNIKIFCKRIDDLYIKVKTLESDEVFYKSINHDLTNSMAGYNYEAMGEFTDGTVINDILSNNYNKDDFEVYLYERRLISIHNFILYMESLYLYTLDSDIERDMFYESHKIDFNINNDIGFLIKDLNFPGLTITNSINGSNVFVEGLRGDLYILLRNIALNAQKNGKADHIDISIEVEKDQIVLCIRDNGTGIDTGKFSNMKDIFILGKTAAQEESQGTGFGLRSPEERKIKFYDVSNNGLPSKFTQEDINKMRKNKDFIGKYNSCGALFQFGLKRIDDVH